MYKVTNQYKQRVEEFILKNGYVIGAFGLKLRGDLSKIYDEFKYQATLRTMVNMTIQSYAMLMNRTIIEFQKAIERDGMEEDVIIQNSVHDSIYLMVKPKPEVIKWVNDNLISIMLWLPEEAKDWVVENEAELEIGKSWITETSIPNNASLNEVRDLLEGVINGV